MTDYESDYLEDTCSYPRVGDVRFFRDDDGKVRKYEFTEDGEWTEL